MLKNLPMEVEEYILPPEESCSVCGSPLVIVGRKVVRSEVEFVPAKLIVKQVIQQVAKCSVCGTAAGENPSCHFQAAVPVPPLAHSLSTPSLIAQVMYQKYVLGLPLARQEKDWYRMGLVLSRSDMANWVIRCSKEWLEPIYWQILKNLREKCGVLHMDETRIQCNKEAGKKASSESFMWVICSASGEEIQAAFFYYAKSRNGDTAKELLSGFHGYLVTDGYSGYEKVEGIIRSLCWSHVRRYFIESIPLDSNGKELPGSKEAEGREFINLLFKVENEIKDLPQEEKKQKRQEASRPILDAFWAWVEKTIHSPGISKTIWGTYR